MKNLFLILFSISLIAICSVCFAETSRIIYVNKTGDDFSSGNFDSPVLSVLSAIEIAKSLKPTIENPVLIQIGVGEFSCPEIWTINNSHIYFAGFGINLTKLISYRIIIAPEIKTGFKDICLLATIDIGDNFLPISNSQLLNLDKKSGQLEGTWTDFSGNTHTSNDAILSNIANQFSEYKNQFNSFSNHFAEIKNLNLLNSKMAPPDQDATNSFVLKKGDRMTGPLYIENYFPSKKIVMSPYNGSTNITAALRLESSDGINWGFHIMFKASTNETIKKANGIHFWSNEEQSMSIYNSFISANYHPIKYVSTGSEYFDAANIGYVDNQVATRIDYVTAGDGLSGGGTSGSISLDINTGNGIEIFGNAVSVDSSILRVSTASNTYFLKENLPIINEVYQFAGPINLNSNSIINLPWPSNDFDAVSKSYVLSVLTNGETVVYISTNELSVVSNNFYFSGDLILKDGQIWGLSEPMSNDNAATKLYVDYHDNNISNFLSTTSANNLNSSVHSISNWIASELNNVVTTGTVIHSDIPLGTLDKFIFYMHGQPRHSIGMPNYRMMNVLGFYANNIFRFYTGNDPENMTGGSLKLEIHPEYSSWKIPVYMSKKLTAPTVLITEKTTTHSLEVTGENNWLVGRSDKGGDIVLQNKNSSIKTRDNSGNDIIIAPDGNGEVIANANMKINGSLNLNGLLNLEAYGGEGGEMRFAPHSTNPFPILDVYGWNFRLLSVDNWGNIRQIDVWDLRKGPIVGKAGKVNGIWKIPGNLDSSLIKTFDSNTQNKVIELEKQVSELKSIVKVLKREVKLMKNKSILLCKAR